ncbi:WD40 repeat domain-containing protein [Candidatus Dependentiae bacterium]|nr:WD40 repeat domain-containing protein [Candidatus Dependentiae bacterium]
MEDIIKQVAQRAIIIASALFMMGSCPPDQVLVKLKGDVEITIPKNKLLFLATKSQTLKELIEDILQQGQLQEIALPDIDEKSFVFLKSLPEAVLNDLQQFDEKLRLEQTKKLGGFESVLDMLNYLDIQLPPSFQNMYSKILKNREELAQQEQLVTPLQQGKRKIESTEETKRLKTEERELFAVIFPKEQTEAQTIIRIFNASTVLKTLIQDIYEVSPEKLAPGKKIVIGNISQEEWEILKKLAIAVRDLNNEENVTHLFNNISFNSEQLLKFLQLADYLDMRILSNVVEKKMANALIKKLLATEAADVATFLKWVSSLPSTAEASIVRNTISQTDFLNSYGWKTEELHLSNYIATNQIISDLIVNEDTNTPIIFLKSPDSPLQILWITKEVYRLTYELAGKGLRISQKGTVCMFLGEQALRFCDLSAKKDMTAIPLEQLGMAASIFDLGLVPGILSNDGTMAAIRTSDTRVQIINLANQKNIRIIPLDGTFSLICTMAFDDAKKTLAIADPTTLEIQLWDISSSPKQRVISVANGIERIWFDKDGNLITKTRNLFVTLDIKSGNQLRSFSATDRILRFNSINEQIIMQNKNNAIKIVGLKTGEVLTSIKVNQELTAAAVNSSDRLFLAAIKNRVNLSRNALRPIVNKLALTQLFTLLMIYQLHRINKQPEFKLPQDMMPYFQALPEELKKESTEKLKIKF